MKKAFVLLMIMMLSAGIAQAGSNVGNLFTLPVPADSSTRADSFGYTWVDSDGGGSPVFNWIDITTIGTEVTGLQDDNNVGPFQLGFEFPYYWYTVNHMQIGSNGYISFSSTQNFAHPFGSIPSDTIPPDLVAVLTGDLDFSRGNGHCYFYTNGTDTAIVSWLNVGEFGFIDSVHNFQLILCRNDSSLTFQYGENHGNFRDTNGANMDVIGIGNVNKRVGLQYLRNNTPSGRMWHSGLAIRWHANPNPNFVAHDCGVLDGLHAGSGADFVPMNQPYIIHGLFKNYGNQTETNVKAKVIVARGSTTIMRDSVFIATMAPGEVVDITFTNQFTPVTLAVHKATFSTTLTGDQNSSNNSRVCELDPYTLPQNLQYTGNVASDARSWNGDFSGFGNEFVMPEAVQLNSASVYVGTVSAPGDLTTYVIDSDSTGLPDFGHILAGDTVSVSDTGWITMNISNVVIPANHKFFAVGIAVLQSTLFIGVDNTAPLSYRGYEYTGGLGPDRDRNLQDIMVRVNASAASGINEDIMPKAFSLSQNYPNPFNAKTNISFSLDRASDVSINIYNVIGQVVGTISGHYLAGKNNVTWDASSAASGVYFYKITVGDRSETKKMVLLK